MSAQCTPLQAFWHHRAMHDPTETRCSLPSGSPDRSPPDAVTVLYDGACPLCRREIGLYRGLDSLQPVAWRDVSAADAVLPPGGTRDAFLARFHVQQADGTILSGAAAFIALWSVLPGWRWLGRVGRLPGMTGLMEIMYRSFLRIRPRMQRLARWLEARGS